MRLKKDPQMQPFTEALRSDLLQEYRAMVGLDAPMVYRAQGRASYLSDLIRFIEGVDNTSALEKPNSGRPMTAGLY
jgi:hypothetical protein